MQELHEVKNIKSSKGHEGETCRNGSIYLSNKKIATWYEDSWGGGLQFQYLSDSTQKDFNAYAETYLQGKSDILGVPFCVPSMEPDIRGYTAMESIVLDAIENVRLKALCKTQQIVTLEPATSLCELGRVDSYNALFTVNEVAHLRKENVNLPEVLNERFGPPLVEGSPEHLKAELSLHKKKCKTQTVFILLRDGRRLVYFIRGSHNTQRAANIRSRHPDCVRILNEEI